MNLRDYPRPRFGIGQYRQPHCAELKGQRFSFAMDGGYRYELDITGEETLTWSMDGSEPKEAAYQCAKGDDVTYLLEFDVAETLETDHRSNELFIIDLAQRLVTRVFCHVGYNKEYPYLVKSEYDFGAIVMEGRETPFIRHCYSSELLGTVAEWHWNHHMWTQHQYYDSDWYNINLPEGGTSRKDLGDPFKILPSADEKCRVIKIKDTMYLFCLTEEMMERITRGPIIRSNNMIFLQNYDRMVFVGRTFGTILRDGKYVSCKAVFGAFGNPVDLPEDVLNHKNGYTV